MSKTYEGYLLIADITGYTMYLSASELEHAQEMLSVLLRLLVEHTPPPLVISQLEGDAVLSYGLRENFFQGQTFVEVIENTYIAFRKAIERMVLNTHCRCNACANISSLDLKFFLHFGTFGIQQIKEHAELVGSDVILIHRLLKNNIQERLGLHAYCLYTEAAINQLGLESMCEMMIPHSEVYEHIKEVKVWVQDMHDVWERKRDANQISIPENQIAMESQVEFEVPLEVLWDYINKPEFRNTMNGSDRYEILNQTGGRTAQGSVYHCYHGDKIIPQTILEYQPFEHMVIQTLLPIPIPKTTVLNEFRLVPIQSGTLYIERMSKPFGPLLGRLIVSMMAPLMSRQAMKLTEAFKKQVEDHWRRERTVFDQSPMVSNETISESAKASLQTN
jgi:hypothetical protein